MKNMMEQAKVYYESEQPYETVEIEKEDFNEFKLLKFRVLDNEGDHLCLFRIRFENEIDTVVELQDFDEDAEYDDFVLLEKKIKEILYNRIRFLKKFKNNLH